MQIPIIDESCTDKIYILIQMIVFLLKAKIHQSTIELNGNLIKIYFNNKYKVH